MSSERIYKGKGGPFGQPADLPPLNRQDTEAPEHYLASDALACAVDVAIRLGMPLLLTGEPGIGKSSLAKSIACELKLADNCHVFHVKSDTSSRDMFYQFDTVARFHEANLSQTTPAPASIDGDAWGRERIDPRRFITFNAIGKAILYTYPPAYLKPILGPAFKALGHPGEPCSSVLLIDEIDKAPRDVPNDLLWEMDEKAFAIPEIAKEVSDLGTDPTRNNGKPAHVFSMEGAKQERIRLQGSDTATQAYTDSLRIITVITSNSEKALPEAFMRRCVYYHLPFPAFRDDQSDRDPQYKPDDQVTIEDIVISRFGGFYASHTNLCSDAIRFFRYVRAEVEHEKPGLSRLLNLVHYLSLVEADKTVTTTPSFQDWVMTADAQNIIVTLLLARQDQASAKALITQWLSR